MHKYTYSAALALALLSAPSIGAAEEVRSKDEVVVTATRARGGIARDQLGGSATVLPAEDLERRQVQIVSDVLRDVPGVAVSRLGTVGGFTQVRIRGAEANQTLVLIDGMDATDVFSQEFEFSTLIADDVARVEVLRGQQSALYGSDAVGGVIQYFTATGAEAPGARGRFEFGSFDTGQLSARVAGVSGPLDWAISGNVYDTGGTPGAPGGSRDLAFDSQTLAGRFGLALSDDLSLTAVLRTRQSQGDFNEDLNFDSIYDDSPDGNFYESEATYGLLRADLSTFGDAWTHALILQGADSRRQDHSTLFGYSENEGQRQKASYVTTFNFGSDTFRQALTGAVDYKEETFETSNIAGGRSIEHTGYVAEYNALVNDRFGFGLALRRDENSRFDSATTYRAQASYAFDTGTRLRAAAGSGIKNPTMAQLFGFFGNFIGNPDLTPEKSDGWEAGVDQSFLNGDLVLGATYFDSELTDQIGSETVLGVSRAVNQDGVSHREGVELTAQAYFGPQWAVDLAYTYLDADEPVAGGALRPERRRAENIASANVSWRTAGDRGGLNLNVRYNGEQYDDSFATFPATPVLLDAFTLVTLGGDWQLTEALQVYGRVENALDEEYTEVYGYATVGRAFYVGLRAGF